MLAWFAQTSFVAAILAFVALAIGRAFRLGPAARHVLWLVVLLKLITPPVLSWPWAIPVRQSAVIDAPATRSASPELDLPDVDEPAERIGTRPARQLIELDADASLTPHEPTAPFIDQDIPRTDFRIFSTIDLERLWLVAWALGCAVLIATQSVVAFRFMNRLRGARVPPDWLVAELAGLANGMRIRSPRVLVIGGSGTPLLWCLTRPVLVVPAELVLGLDRLQWRGVLAHELAHIRRGDVWVSRMILVAGWLWWWNPLYWCVKHIMERDAELACDAWAVELGAENRRCYAESLIEVCSLMSVSGPASLRVAPALGMSARGDGRFFERRLTMILRGRALHRYPWAVKAVAGLLALVAMPMWSAGQSAPVPPRDDDQDRPREERAERARPPLPPLPPELPAVPDDEEQAAEAAAPSREAQRQLERARAAEVRARAAADRVRARRVERAEADDDEAKDNDGGEARRHAEERVREAEKRVLDLQEHLRGVQDRARDHMHMAQEHMRQQIASLSGASQEVGGDADGDDSKEANKRREEARTIVEKLRKDIEQLNDRTRREMQEAHEALRRAHAELSEAARQVGAGGEAPRAARAARAAAPARVEPPRTPDQPEAPSAPRAAVARRAFRVDEAVRAPMAARGMPPGAQAGDIERLEHRLDQLEEKFDRILEELRSMRRERQ